MISPLESLFQMLKSNKHITILEKERKVKHEGYLKGFDEYFNIVLESDGTKKLIRGDVIEIIYDN